MQISKIEIETFDYSFMIRANGGEEHLSIVSTIGQSGHISMRVLVTSVDGGPVGRGGGVSELLYVPYGKLKVVDAWKALEPVLVKWGCSEENLQVVKRQWDRYQESQNW